MKNSITSLFLLLLLHQAYGQADKAIIKGRLMSKQTGNACGEVQLLLPRLKRIYSTDSAGRFRIEDLPYTELSIYTHYGNETTDSFMVTVHNTQGMETELGDIWINEPVIHDLSNDFATVPVLALEESPQQPEEEGNALQQDISILLLSARDAFQQAASFVLSQYGFRPRAYGRSAQQVYINGALMNDLVSGYAVWGQWSGLNDVLRNTNNTYGLSMHQRALGGVNGTSFMDIAAPEQTPQKKFSHSLSNRTYTHKVCFTHSSGIGKKGWATAISAGLWKPMFRGLPSMPMRYTSPCQK